MGANMAKQPTYTYGFPPRRRTSNIENVNHFSKDFWGANGTAAPDATGAKSGAEFWMVDSERRYRQQVFDRESENFYPSASTYRAQGNFESPFTFNNSPTSGHSKSKNFSGSSSSHTLPSVPPPYTSRNTQQSIARAGEPKYLPRCVVGM